MNKLFVTVFLNLLILQSVLAQDQCIDCSASSSGDTRRQVIDSIAKEFNIDLQRCNDMEFFVTQVAEARGLLPSTTLPKTGLGDHLSYRTKSLEHYATNCEKDEALAREVDEIKKSKLAVEIALEKINLEKRAEEIRRAKLPGVRLGMTEKQVINGTNWGHPKSVNRSVGSWGVHEQWIYGGGHYLYFQNGRLTAYQN